LLQFPEARIKKQEARRAQKPGQRILSSCSLLQFPEETIKKQEARRAQKPGQRILSSCSLLLAS
jgi:hypothetical protein